MTRHSYSACVSFGTDGEDDYNEIDVTVSYIVHAGRSETPPSYSHGGLPAEPAEIDDIRVEMIDGKPPVTGDCLTVDAILCELASGRHDEDMFSSAAEDEAAWRDEAADARMAARWGGRMMTDPVNVPRDDAHCVDPAAWDEFCRQHDGEKRPMAGVSDFALANAVYLCDRNDLDLIKWQTAAKERIRWLSIEMAKAKAILAAAPKAEPVSDLPPISFDGPHKPNDHRVWLARQLLDSKNDDTTAYGIAAFHPAISDLWKKSKAFKAISPEAPKVGQEPVAWSRLKRSLTDSLLTALAGRIEDVDRAIANHKGPQS